MPFADGEFDLAGAIEVLEHVPDPEHTVAEMARVASRWLLVSVPREPLWRGLNLARGAYVRDLGNTPGHLNHWCRRALRRAARAATARSSRPGRRSPGRCSSSAWVTEATRSEAAPPRSGPARADASYARGARVLSVGIASTGVFTFAYFAVAGHVLGDRQYGEVSLLWAVLFVVISVIYRPVEQLLSRTIARRRAQGATSHPLRVPLALQAGFALVFLVVALALRAPLEDLFGTRALYWIFVGATLAYAASYFARGYVAGHGWFGLYGGLVLFESISRFCFPVAVAAGLASGQTAVALGIAGRPARLPARRAGRARAPRGPRPRAGRRLGGRARARRRRACPCARGPGSRWPSRASSWPSRRCSTPPC